MGKHKGQRDTGGHTIRLYHFTSKWHLRAIRQSGSLSVGEVPLSPVHVATAVNLTCDPDPTHQGWQEPKLVNGVAIHNVYCKTDIRITIDLDRRNPRLRKWSEFAKRVGVEDWWYQALDKAGGGGSDHWWLYFGRIALKDTVSTNDLSAQRTAPERVA